jgi:hypothetical protein
VIIRVERSGGVAGIPFSKEVDTKDLPSRFMTTAKKIMLNSKSFTLPKSAPMGAADHFSYKISIQDGKEQSVIECNQYNVQDDLNSLIKYIERKSNSE